MATIVDQPTDDQPPSCLHVVHTFAQRRFTPVRRRKHLRIILLCAVEICLLLLLLLLLLFAPASTKPQAKI